MVIFLGAGASKPFELHDMNELTDIVIKELKTKYINTWIIEEIKKKVKRFGMKPDIESILSCIDSLCDPQKEIKDAGPFAALISQFSKTEDITYGQKKEYYKKLATEIRKIIRNHCFLPEDEKIPKIVDVYNNLFEKLLFGIRNDLFVFTTNYDNCFETYCLERGYDFFDGFRQKGGIQIFKGFDNPNRTWKICKLHGSSNYVVTNRNEIVKTDNVVEIGKRITAGRIVKESMIFPTTEKYFSKSPYIDLINCLRRELISFKISKKRFGDNFIVIGYSFRDIPINNAFIEAFEKGCFQEYGMVFIDPEANKIINKNIPELKDIIHPFDKKFEEITENEVSVFK